MLNVSRNQRNQIKIILTYFFFNIEFNCRTCQLGYKVKYTILHSACWWEYDLHSLFGTYLTT